MMADLAALQVEVDEGCEENRQNVARIYALSSILHHFFASLYPQYKTVFSPLLGKEEFDVANVVKIFETQDR